MVPDPDVLPSFAAKLGVKGSLEELCQNQVSLTMESFMHPMGACHGRGEAPPARAPMGSQSHLSGRTDSSCICDRWLQSKQIDFIRLEDRMGSLKTTTTKLYSFCSNEFTVGQKVGK